MGNAPARAVPPAWEMPPHGQCPLHGKCLRTGRSPAWVTYDYNANNEQVYYKEFRTEAADNLASKNYYNPYYINGYLGR